MTVMHMKQPAVSMGIAQMQAAYGGTSPVIYDRPVLCAWFDGAMKTAHFEEAALQLASEP